MTRLRDERSGGQASPRHFLDLSGVAGAELRRILAIAARFKAARADAAKPLAGRTLAMIFDRPSTRTRVSFEVGMMQLGGNVVTLHPHEMQIGRGETIADTARVLSRYVDMIVMRTADTENLYELAKHATVPVINGLTRRTHPCQLMADVMTFEEHRGPIAGKIVAWTGDGNNMACTWIEAAARFAFELRLACPPGRQPDQDIVAWAKREGATIELSKSAQDAVADADCVVTDTWVSIGDDGADRHHNLFAPYRVDRRLMELARPDALFMHCLPAHRGEEVTDEVIDGARSVVWDEAENRLHAQKGILTWCLG